MERIIAMIPFPYIFKARSLSKSWMTKFSQTASLSEGEEKRIAISFQNRMREWSQNWETFFCIIFGKDLYLPSVWASGGRSRLPSLAFLPQKLQVTSSNPEIEGPLVFGCVRSNQLMYVANILTKSWKKLPPHLDAGGSIFCWKRLVIEPSFKTYKVVVFCRDPNNQDFRCSAHIYHSKSHAWTLKYLSVSKIFKTLCPPVLLNGVLYMVADHDVEKLLAFNVETETLEELRLSFAHGLATNTAAHLVVCNDNLLMIVSEGAGAVHVLKVDLLSRQLLVLARGPPAAFNLAGFRTRQPVSDGRSIFFGTFQSGEFMHMVAYNVKHEQWRCFAFPYDMSLAFQDMTYYSCDWSAISFRPGLNPFMEV